MSQNQLTASYIARNGHPQPGLKIAQEHARELVIDNLSHVTFVRAGKAGTEWYNAATREHEYVFDQ